MKATRAFGSWSGLLVLVIALAVPHAARADRPTAPVVTTTVRSPSATPLRAAPPPHASPSATPSRAMQQSGRAYQFRKELSVLASMNVERVESRVAETKKRGESSPSLDEELSLARDFQHAVGLQLRMPASSPGGDAKQIAQFVRATSPVARKDVTWGPTLSAQLGAAAHEAKTDPRALRLSDPSALQRAAFGMRRVTLRTVGFTREEADTLMTPLPPESKTWTPFAPPSPSKVASSSPPPRSTK